ncbi:DUF5071 domain-containing protein [Cohnella soli]|uniref:DUF5071 domain-containing protein n=1 Tax=Cohnella soli TaxID=425005 RepID=A0ABW0HPG1_9BACL
MNNLKELIPKDKHDSDAVERLNEVDFMKTDISPIIDELFEWIQNINWPVAQELCKVIPKFKTDYLLPQIRKILNSNDDCWQYSCIRYLVPELSKDMLELIKDDLLRIINNPTNNESLCEIDQDAKEIFDRLY